MTNPEKCPRCGEDGIWDRAFGKCYRCEYGRTGWKSRLRAWAISIVRDAIKIEFSIPIRPPIEVATVIPGKSPVVSYIPHSIASKESTATYSPILFEEMQDQSLKEQEIYHALESQ